jgi:hypothetical protein
MNKKKIKSIANINTANVATNKANTLSIVNIILKRPQTGLGQSSSWASGKV